MFKRQGSVGRLPGVGVIRRHSRTLVPLALLAMVGCRVPPPAVVASGPPNPGPSTREVSGDWDDVEAVVRTAMRRCQFVYDGRVYFRTDPTSEPDIVEYKLIMVRGDTGLLRVKRGPVEGILVVSCRVGALGSAEAEACILDEVESRLARLHGRDYAPLEDLP